MKTVVLTDEEIELLEAIENGEFVSIKNFAQAKKDVMMAAKNTVNKTKNIDIRLSEKDLLKAKAKAAETDIPYQTLLSSVIH